jgi:hypothetical protein
MNNKTGAIRAAAKKQSDIPWLDEQDSQWRDGAALRRLERRAPGVGDWVLFPDGKEPLRIAQIWEADLFGEAVMRMACGRGEFHLHRDGQMSYTGGMGKPVPAELSHGLRVREAEASIYHHGVPADGNTVRALVPVRVWKTPQPCGSSRKRPEAATAP